MLPVLLALALGQMGVGALPDPEGPIFPSGKYSYADFELAPPTGLGMTAPCACAAVTNHLGVSISTSRASPAWCLKQGSWKSTGIANGDAVECASNQVRVEPDGSGYLGLQEEYSGTNLCLRSRTLNDAVWNTAAFGGGVTVTANTATAPNGAMEADRLQFNSCSTGGAASGIYQAIVGAGTHTGSVFLKMNSGGPTGTVSVCFDSGAGTSTCSTCNVNTTTWERCSNTGGGGNPNFIIGCVNNSYYAGFASTTAQDLLVWQAHVETTAFVRTPITTDGATANRAIETPTITFPPTFSTSGCMRAYVTPNFSGTVSGNGGLYLGSGSNNRYVYRDSGASGRVNAFNGSVSPSTGADVPYVRGVASLVRGVFTGTQATLTGGLGSVGPTAYVPPAAGVNLEVGASVASGATEGVISRIRIDDNQGNCP